MKRNDKSKKCIFGLLNSLGWSPGCNNDNLIIETIVQRKPVNGVYSLNEAGLLDSFFSFIHEAVTGYSTLLNSQRFWDFQIMMHQKE